MQVEFVSDFLPNPIGTYLPDHYNVGIFLFMVSTFSTTMISLSSTQRLIKLPSYEIEILGNKTDSTKNIVLPSLSFDAIGKDLDNLSFV